MHDLQNVLTEFENVYRKQIEIICKNLISTLFGSADFQFNKQNNLSSKEHKPHTLNLITSFAWQNKVMRLVSRVHIRATEVVLFEKWGKNEVFNRRKFTNPEKKSPILFFFFNFLSYICP